MIYIIDHQDSFTWNVVHQFAKFDKVICSNYYEVNERLSDKVVTKISLLKNYCPAEEYHQKYLEKR